MLKCVIPPTSGWSFLKPLSPTREYFRRLPKFPISPSQARITQMVSRPNTGRVRQVAMLKSVMLVTYYLLVREVQVLEADLV